MTESIYISREQDVIDISDIPGFIAGALEPYSKIGFSTTKQAAIEKEHQTEIEKASLNGELIGLNRLTKTPEPFAIAYHLKRQVLTIEKANEYTRRFGVEIKYKPLPDESGRYTLEEAATKISAETGEGESGILKMLVEAVKQEKLIVYLPGSDVNYRPTRVHEFYEEVYWDDINIWMDEFLSRIKWRIPNPDGNDHEQITLAAAAGSEPDYQEYLALDKSVELSDLINYSLGVPPEPDDRNRLDDPRERDYTQLLKRAESAIHSQTLNATKEDGVYRILKKDFRIWIEQQGFALNERYEEAESLPNSRELTGTPVKDEHTIGNPQYNISITEKRKRELHAVFTIMIQEGAFAPRDRRWPRIKIWQRAVNDHPDLFPDEPADQREGVFAKAYNRGKRDFA